MKKLLTFILICVTAFSCTLFTGCKKIDVENEWKIVAYDDGNGQVLNQRVCFDVTRNSKKIDEIWIKVTAMQNNVESVNFTFQRYTTNTTNGGTTGITAAGTALTTAVSKQQVKDATKNTNGWIKVTATAWQHNSSYVLMICQGNITIDEIVFISEEGKRLEYEVEHADIVYENTEGDLKQKVYSKAELEAITDAKYGLPLNLNNNQESFDSKDKKD
ncbi:MAG: hypothetical protein E7360_01000 [Clostridiales bacterium]|nr:hypothetical protein [Clostridiales bacterium]